MDWTKLLNTPLPTVLVVLGCALVIVATIGVLPWSPQSFPVALWGRYCLGILGPLLIVAGVFLWHRSGRHQDEKKETLTTATPPTAVRALPEFTTIDLYPPEQPPESANWRRTGDTFARTFEFAADPVFDIMVRYASTDTLAVNRVGVCLLERRPEDGGTLGSPTDVEVHAELEVHCPEKWKQISGTINQTVWTRFKNPKVLSKENPRLRFALKLENFCDKYNASLSEVKFLLETEDGTAESKVIRLRQ